MASRIRLFTFVCVFLLAQPLLASEDSQPELSSESPGQRRVELQPYLDAVARQTQKKFLLEARVSRYLSFGGIEPKDVTYPILLSILRINGYAAVTMEGIVNVVPDALARSLPTPIIYKADPAIADDEWVTRVVTLKYIDGKEAVPVLRPLMKQPGHMATLGDKALLLVDTYDNTLRLAELLQVMDKPSSVKRTSPDNGDTSAN